VERMMWLGMRDLINHWRVKYLNLEPSNSLNWTAHRLRNSVIPHTYCYSRYLLPKPLDWDPWIKVSGFWFLENAEAKWEPPAELLEFLESKPPPVFIGFGSIVVQDPDALTRIVTSAVKLARCRAVIQKGWAGMSPIESSESIHLLGPVPHDWLFPRCSVVVHHGGAGTTAAGLYWGKPTVIVPFFGDQFFWGKTVHGMGLGPLPIPHSSLTAENLAQAILDASDPNKFLRKAQRIGQKNKK